MTTFRDDRRYGEHEAYHRDPGPDFSPEAIAAQTQAFLCIGGKVQVIPTGLSGYKPPSLRPDKAPKGVRVKCGPQIVVNSGRKRATTPTPQQDTEQCKLTTKRL